MHLKMQVFGLRPLSGSEPTNVNLPPHLLQKGASVWWGGSCRTAVAVLALVITNQKRFHNLVQKVLQAVNRVIDVEEAPITAELSNGRPIYRSTKMPYASTSFDLMMVAPQ